MKNKKAKSKVQAILMERNMKIVDLFNKIKEENAKPVAKYMISQIVNGKRTNYEIITLNKICKALNVSANEIIEENPTRYSSTKSIKSNTKSIKSNTPKSRAKRSGRVVVPEMVDVDINMHSGNGYIDDIVDEKALEDIKRTLNMKEEEEERETRIYNDSFNVDPKDRIEEDQEPLVEHDGMRYNPENAEETLEFTDEQNHTTRKNTDYSPPEEETEEEDDDFGF